MTKKKIQKKLAWFLAWILAISVSFPQNAYAEAETETVAQEETSAADAVDDSIPEEQEEETVSLEGIRLSTSSLVMKTGEQKNLTATLLPENTTEQPEITWSSDDTDVVQVTGEGTSAVVTAPEGEGGTAVITVTAGDYTASCRVLVTVQEPMLESMIFMQNSSGSNRYELTEAEEGVREYTLRVPESTNVVYVRPQLRDDVQDAQITAKFTDITSGEEVSVDLPTDEVTSLTSSAGRLLKAYNIQPVELTLEVTEGSYTEVHKIHVVRGTYLGSLQITDDEGGEVAYTPTFKKTVYEYSVHVPSSRKYLQMQLKGAEKTSTVLTVNGEPAEQGSYTLPLTEGTMKVVMQAGDGEVASPYSYILTVYVDTICYVSIATDPEDAVVAVYDADKVQVDPKNGRYELIKGQTYSYTVSAPGYQTESGQFQVSADEEKKITLKQSSGDQQEDVDAEWGGYWKTDDNLNIVDAPMPGSLSSAEVLWKQQYGTFGNYTNSISDGILVDGKICCFQGNELLYLDPVTSETLTKVKMRDKGNSAFTKPLYAAGMIFVPLTNGRIQAFNAKTLKSLWLYTDIIGGNTATALRYDSGYLYAGFADGNLVCLFAGDEDPEQTEEEKTAVWRKYDSGGYYRTGVYTGETYLYACGRSGNLYCLNKKTGQTVQTVKLPDETGIASTAICQDQGRLYFATENGYLCSYPLAEDGTIDTEHAQVLSIDGTIFGTPVIYEGRIYVGSAGKDRYGTVHNPYHLNVIQVDADGNMTLAYQMAIDGCPKGTPTLTTAYAKEDGYVYVYFTTDSSNGGIYLLKDKAGLTQPGEGSGLFYQQTEVNGSGSGTILTDSRGNLYVRYESGWMYAIKSSALYLEEVKIAEGSPVIDNGGAFDGQAQNHTVVLEAGISEITMNFQVADGVTVTVNGQEGASRKVALQDGRAEVEVVLSKDGQTRQYSFQIRTKSSDATLGTLQVSFSSIVYVMEMELEPAFQKDVLEYNSSLYGDGKDREPYYVWPIASDSKATVKVTVVSGVNGYNAGDEIEAATAVFDDQVRARYKVRPSSENKPALINIEVTAEDGKTTKDYTLKLFRDNAAPKITAGTDAVVTREKNSAKIRITANMDGYLYYLFADKEDSNKIPTANEMKTNGKRIAIRKGEQTVELDGLRTGEGVMYLYEMAYSQRFSNGIQVDIPEYSDSNTPVDPGDSDKGDINRDGIIDLVDVVQILNEVTAGRSVDTEIADFNEDGIVDMRDVLILLNTVTK